MPKKPSLIVRINNCLPSIVAPALEMHAREVPVEYMGPVWGTKLEKNAETPRTYDIAQAFPFITPAASKYSVYDVFPEELAEIDSNLKHLVTSGLQRLGDFHVHIAGEGVEDVLGKRSLVEVKHHFQKAVAPGPNDKATMKKTGLVYLIVGFAPYRAPFKTRITRPKDQRSAIVFMEEYAFCISAHHFYRPSGRFQKAQVNISGPNGLFIE